MKKTILLAALLAATFQSLPANAATFLFIRHAESKANDGSAQTVDELIDPTLTALGEQQAQALVGTLASYDITNIYVSGYQRTAMTIAPTAEARGLTPIADDRTSEWYFGDLQSIDDLNYNQVYGVIGGWIGGNTAAKLPFPNSESLDDVVGRVVPAWEEIVAKHKDEDGVVVLVGHGISTGFVMPYFAQNVSTGFAFQNSLHNTGIITVEMINDKPYVTNWEGQAFAVPEPASWAMMIGGFGLVGGALRRRRMGSAHA